MESREKSLMLEVRHLRMVRAIEANGSVTAASEALGLTQPAVSHGLRDLERQLGVSLFQRSGKGMRPTPACRRLLESAETVLRELEQVEGDLARHRDGRQGALRITTECYTCYHWMPRVLAAFAAEYPDYDVRIAPEVVDDPAAALVEDRTDLVIVHSPIDHPRLLARPLFRDELVAIVAPVHELADRPFLDAADFAREHVILHSRPEESLLFTHLLRPNGVRPARTSELRLTEAVVESVKAGLGISVVARWTVQPELADGSIQAVRLTRRGLHRRWSAALPRHNARRPAVRRMIELLKRECPAPPARS